MAFSDTFGFGNSTFDDLESQLKHAIDGNANQNKETDETESISQSPKKQNNTKIRSRVFSNSNLNDTYKRKWRKSKSDSKLLNNDVNVASKNENLTQFFQSDFAFSLHEQSKIKEISKQKPLTEESVVRVSQIEENLDDDKFNNDEFDGGLVSAWEMAIVCSEDLPSFMQTEEEKATEDSELDLKFSNSLELKANTEKVINNLEASKHETAKQMKADVADLSHLDATCFMCPVEDELSKTSLENVLEASKLVLKQLHGTLELTAKAHELSKSLMPSTQKNKSTNSHENKTSKPATAIKDVESLKLITAWGLPTSILAEYEKKGILKMFDWQVECLSNSKILFEHCNLVYSAPTSAGKTLVSEILLLKTVLERNKKVLMILPFISVVREKMFYLQDLLTPAGYRVEGFFGGYTPPGGFDSINVAICTIEKANSIINKLLEQNKLECLGTIVVDEIHLISDPGRGYILELLLAKILYMSRKYGLRIQIITMSATLANVELLKRWLDAELFITNYRPVALNEMIKVGTKIFDANMTFLRDLKESVDENVPILNNDIDNVAQLCLETILEGCSVIIFCPSKDWCEKLSIQLASVIHGLGKSGSDLGLRLRQQLKREAIDEVKRQLLEIPTGLDSVLEKTITFGCAFHHAGLTTEERDIIEASFKNGALKIIAATSTLSSGVNLPARRVLIRTPLFGGKQMSSLTYKQMIGRAGRTGKDTLGESILICTEANARTGRDLVTAELKPITSCLELDNSTHLKRALLEVISSGVANTKVDINLFVNCTLLSAQKHCSLHEKDTSSENAEDFISNALAFLIEYEFVRLQCDAENGEENYIATRLGLACLASSMPPADGLILFTELQKCRRCFVLESELHAVYLVTPYSVCYQMQEMDWLFFLDLWEKLSPAMRKVGELVGVKESFLVRAMRGQTKLDYKMLQIHKRFYTALALQELVNETPINVVAQKYKCTRGLLQSLQQMSATFAGIVTAFCNALQWDTLSLIVSQFKERLYFGIHRDLIDLMRLPDLSHKRARVLFDAGITTLVELANADVLNIEKVLHNSLSFDSAKQQENENSFEAEQRHKARNFFITGKAGMTEAEAAKLLINEARQFVEYDIGAVGSIKWTQTQQKEEKEVETNAKLQDMHMSCEENDLKILTENKKRKSTENLNVHETPTKLIKFIDKAIENEAVVAVSKATREEKQQEKDDLKQLQSRKPISSLDHKLPSEKHLTTKNENLVFENINKRSNRKRIEDVVESPNKLIEFQQNFDNIFDEDFNLELSKESKTQKDNCKVAKSMPQTTQNNKDLNLQTCSKQKSAKSTQNLNQAHNIFESKTNICIGKQKVETKCLKSKENEESKKATHRKDQPQAEVQRNGKAEFQADFESIFAEDFNEIEIKPSTATVSKTNNTKPQKVLTTVEKKCVEETIVKNSLNGEQPTSINKTSHLKQNNLNNETPKQSINNLTKTTPKAKETIHKFEKQQQQQPRRSPRNHAAKTALSPSTQVKAQKERSSKKSCFSEDKPMFAATTTRTTSTVNEKTTKEIENEDLFANEESFELNSGITAALAMVEKPANKTKTVTVATPTKTTTTRTTSDEIPSSQNINNIENQTSNTFGTPRQTTRFLRSYRTQRLPSPLANKAPTTEQPNNNNNENSSKSLAGIDVSLESHDSAYVMQMNASHILSCSKHDDPHVSLSARKFNAIEIIDFCGNFELFKLACQEILKAKRFGFCLGLEQLPNKRKPLIGANLLINQIDNKINSNEIEQNFQIDEKYFLAGIAFCLSENIVLYMNLQENEECDAKISTALKTKCLQKILGNSELTLIVYEARKQLKLLRKAMPQLGGGIKVQLEDPKVANWLLQPDQRLSLKHLAQLYAPECSSLVNLCGGGRGDKSHGIDASSAISAKMRCSIEACIILHILEGQFENLDRIGSGELRKFFHDLEMPMQRSLCDMEIIGFPANEKALRDLYQKMLDTSKKLETKIFSLHGRRFNLSSAQSVGKVLGLCRKSNGRVSTSRQVLEKIDDPLAQLIIAYRKLSVTMSKNIQLLLQSVQNNRIHGQSDSFTATGRISMKEPNLQNVAKDFDVDYGLEKVSISCRSAFFPTDPDRCLVSADFCQLEMRTLAHMSKDSVLLKTMKSPNDVFTAIAAVWNNVKEIEVSEQLRNGTKQICYGIIYGMGMRALAEALKCTEEEAQQVSEQFHEAYPAIRVFTRKVIDFARQNGYIETIQGRKRYLENINSPSSNLKSQAERQAVNSAIQGSAADIAKRAILRTEKSILKYCPKLGLAASEVQFVLHLHDELIFEVPTAKAKKIAKIISLTMESCTKLEVPLKVKLKMGRSWGEMKEINF